MKVSSSVHRDRAPGSRCKKRAAATSRVAEVYHGRAAEDNARPRGTPLLTDSRRSGKIPAMALIVRVPLLPPPTTAASGLRATDGFW
jgi:hypothetical protein